MYRADATLILYWFFPLRLLSIVDLISESLFFIGIIYKRENLLFFFFFLKSTIYYTGHSGSQCLSEIIYSKSTLNLLIQFSNIKNYLENNLK